MPLKNDERFAAALTMLQGIPEGKPVAERVNAGIAPLWDARALTAFVLIDANGVATSIRLGETMPVVLVALEIALHVTFHQTQMSRPVNPPALTEDAFVAAKLNLLMDAHWQQLLIARELLKKGLSDDAVFVLLNVKSVKAYFKVILKIRGWENPTWAQLAEDRVRLTMTDPTLLAAWRAEVQSGLVVEKNFFAKQWADRRAPAFNAPVPAPPSATTLANKNAPSSMASYSARYLAALTSALGGATVWRTIGAISADNASHPHEAVFFELSPGKCLATTIGMGTIPIPVPVREGFPYFELCAFTDTDSPKILWTLSNIANYMLKAQAPMFFGTPKEKGDAILQIAKAGTSAQPPKPFRPFDLLIVSGDDLSFMFVPRLSFSVEGGPPLDVVEPLPLSEDQRDELRSLTTDGRKDWLRKLGDASAQNWLAIIASTR